MFKKLFLFINQHLRPTQSRKSFAAVERSYYSSQGLGGLSPDDVAVKLKENGFDPNPQCITGMMTPLMVCTDALTIEVLLKAKADPNSKDSEGWTPLMYSAEADTLEILKLLLLHKADPHIRNNRGATPLMFARDVQIAKALLDAKANPEARDNDGTTALMLVEDVSLIKLLVEYKISLDAKNNQGKTAVHLASAEGHTDGLRVLIELKGNVKACDKEMKIPIMDAWNAEVARILLNADSSCINQTDSYNGTAILWASWRGRADVVKTLAEFKVNLEAKDCEGRSSLILAARFGQLETVQVLIECKADLNTQGSDGKTAFDWAQEEGNDKIIEIMERAKKQIIFKQGILLKEGKAKNWKTRFFVLTSDTLIYFIDETASFQWAISNRNNVNDRNLLTAKGFIPLNEISKIEILEYKEKQVIEITSSKSCVYHITCDDIKILNEWLEMILINQK